MSMAAITSADPATKLLAAKLVAKVDSRIARYDFLAGYSVER